MAVVTMHPEDVKAVLRKRHGSVRSFVAKRGLPANGVSDLFRGRVSQRVREAIERELGESIKLDCSAARTPVGGVE